MNNPIRAWLERIRVRREEDNAQKTLTDILCGLKTDPRYSNPSIASNDEIKAKCK